MNSNKKQDDLRLAPESLYHSCDLSRLPFQTTADLEEEYEHLGQKRAMDALKFGIGIKHDGYNLFVLGSTGVGKNTTVKKLLAKESAAAETPSDWCYINNFTQHHKPLVLKLPAGRGNTLKSDMLQLLEELLVAIPAAFESDEYRTRVQTIQEEYKDKEIKVFKDISDRAEEKNITLLRTPSGYTLAPKKDGKVLAPSDFEKLDESEQEEIKRIVDEIEVLLIEAIRKIPELYKENRDLLAKLQDAYRDLMALDMHEANDRTKGHDFVSSNLAGLHHLYDNPDQDYIDKLQMLSNLKANGAITEYEFKEIKHHYLKTITMGN